MAPKQKNGKKNSKPARARGQRIPRENRLEAYAALLADPCHATPVAGFYPGDTGIAQRFVKTFSVTTGATDTALNFAFSPGSLLFSQGVATNGATVLTNQFTYNGIPGGNYLDANSNKTRCLAACVQMWSNQAALNITGTVAFGLVPATVQQSGASTTADGLSSVLSNQTKLTADVIEVKWAPGAADQYFHQKPNPVTAMPSDADDRNCIVFVGTGLPVNTTYTFRVTWVAEWVPKPSLEIVTNSANSGSGSSAAYDVVKAMHKANPGWNVSVKPFAHAFAQGALPHLITAARSAGSGLANAAVNYGPRMLYNAARAVPLLTL